MGPHDRQLPNLADVSHEHTLCCPTTLLPGTVGLVVIPSTRQHSPSMASQMTSAGMSCPHSPTTAQWISAAGKSHATQATDKNYHVRHQLAKQHGQPHHALPGPQHPDYMRGQTTTPSIQQLHCWMRPITAVPRKLHTTQQSTEASVITRQHTDPPFSAPASKQQFLHCPNRAINSV